MPKGQAVHPVDLPHPASGDYLEHRHCEVVREVYRTMRVSGLNKFTPAWIDSLSEELSAVIYELDRLPEPGFQELMDVILRLREARNELQLARFLFGVEEIQPLHCLLMRNRAVLRGERLLQRVLQGWPLHARSTVGV